MSFTGMSFAQKKPYSVTWQQFNVHTPPLLQIGELATKPADGTGNSRWSVGCETLDRDYADFSKYKQLERELVSLTIDGLSLKEAVYVEPITGRIYDLSCVILRGGMSGGKIRFSRLPLWDSPIFIMEKSCVPFKPGKE